jgi:hypothetical protein
MGEYEPPTFVLLHAPTCTYFTVNKDLAYKKINCPDVTELKILDNNKKKLFL